MNKPKIGDTKPAPPKPSREKPQRREVGVPARYRTTADGTRYLFGQAFGTAFVDQRGRIFSDVDSSRITKRGLK